MRKVQLISGAVIAVVLGTSLLHGVDKPPESKPVISIGEMRIQTVPPLIYLYTSAETSFSKMGEPIKAGFDKVFSAAADAKLLIARPTMLVYQGNPHFNPQKDFKMEIGIIVADDTAAVADVRVRKTAPFKCATILYTGPVAEQGQAYQKLIPAMTAAGLTPTGEERELCLLWEGPDSVNNIFMMQIGIK
jgi:effector-binding domain-containing protein